MECYVNGHHNSNGDTGQGGKVTTIIMIPVGSLISPLMGQEYELKSLNWCLMAQETFL